MLKTEPNIEIFYQKLSTGNIFRKLLLDIYKMHLTFKNVVSFLEWQTNLTLWQRSVMQISLTYGIRRKPTRNFFIIKLVHKLV